MSDFRPVVGEPGWFYAPARRAEFKFSFWHRSAPILGDHLTGFANSVAEIREKIGQLENAKEDA